MIPKTAILVSLLMLSACQQFTELNRQGSFPSHSTENIYQVSADNILSCLASTKQLSEKKIRSEFDSLMESLEEDADNTNMNRVLCLSLHPHSSLKQLQQGENILKGILKDNEGKQKTLTGLLFIIQGNILLHKTYLNKNWKLHVEKKKLCEKKEISEQEIESEITSYQRRIQDLEKQVQKLIEIESMLDQKVKP